MDNFQETELHKLHLRLVALEGTAGHALHLAPSHKVGLLSVVRVSGASKTEWTPAPPKG